MGVVNALHGQHVVNARVQPLLTEHRQPSLTSLTVGSLKVWCGVAWRDQVHAVFQALLEDVAVQEIGDGTVGGAGLELELAQGGRGRVRVGSGGEGHMHCTGRGTQW